MLHVDLGDIKFGQQNETNIHKIYNHSWFEYLAQFCKLLNKTAQNLSCLSKMQAIYLQLYIMVPWFKKLQ